MRFVSSGSCAWFPFHRVGVLQPAERNVLILVRSRARTYYLCSNAAVLGNGAEIFPNSVLFYSGVCIFFVEAAGGTSDAYAD